MAWRGGFRSTSLRTWSVSPLAFGQVISTRGKMGCDQARAEDIVAPADLAISTVRAGVIHDCILGPDGGSLAERISDGMNRQG